MRSIILLSWLFIGAASAEMITKPNLIISDEPFAQDGTVEMSEMKLLSTVEINKTEKGVLNGVHYSFYYTDGSGTFSGTPRNTGSFMEPSDSNWSVECKKDPISDKKMCHMNTKDLWIYVHGNGKAVLSIGAEHFPGSSVTVRIDGGTPFTTSSANDGDFSPSCRIPDDCIDSKRYPLFMAREVMKQLIDNLCVTTAVKPGALS